MMRINVMTSMLLVLVSLERPPLRNHPRRRGRQRRRRSLFRFRGVKKCPARFYRPSFGWRVASTEIFGS